MLGKARKTGHPGPSNIVPRSQHPLIAFASHRAADRVRVWYREESE